MSEPIEFTDFTSPAYKLDPVNSASSDMWNFYCEVIEKGPRTGKLRIRQIPGMKTFITLPDQPVRGTFSVDGGNRLFAVAGSSVFEVFSDRTSQRQTGDIALSSHPVTICSNGFQIAIASGGLGYLVNGTAPGQPGVILPISFTDGTPLQAATIDFLDQYFIANTVNSKQVFVSNLAPAGATWDPGDTAIKEGYADNIARVFCDNEQLWLFGFETTEVWTDTGQLFPFGRIQGAVLKFGCSAPYSVAGALGYRFWFWNGAVYGAYGLNPDRISDYGVEQEIKKYPVTSDAEGWCQVVGGHIFYVLNFPTAGRTWVYDTATAPGPVGPVPLKAWHRRGFWKNGKYSIYRGRTYAKAFGLDLVGDPQSGNIYQLDDATYTDAEGGILRRQRTCPYISANMRNERYNRLMLDCDTGVGLPLAPGTIGADPQVIMRYSKNRGKTYSNERQASMGPIGQDDTRVIFNQLGSARIGMVFDVVVTDPVPSVFNAAYLSIGQPEVGR